MSTTTAADMSDTLLTSPPASPDYPNPPAAAASEPTTAPNANLLFDSDGPLEDGEVADLIFAVKPVAPQPQPQPAAPSPDEVVVATGSAPAPAPAPVAKPAAVRIDLSGPASPPTGVAVEMPPSSPPLTPVASPNFKRKDTSDSDSDSGSSSDSDSPPVKKVKVALPPPPPPTKVGSIKLPPPTGKGVPVRKIMYWKNDVRPLLQVAAIPSWTETNALLSALDSVIENQGSWADGLTWLLSNLRSDPARFTHGHILSALSWAGIACGQRKTVVERYKLAIGDTPGSDSEHDQDTAIGELAKQKMMKWLWRYSLHGVFIQFKPEHVCMFKRNMVPTKDETTPNLLKYWIGKKQTSPPQPIW